MRERLKTFGDRLNIWLVILVFSVLLVGMGAAQIVQYNTFTGYIKCQANYNQQSSEARAARVPAGTKERRTFYRWLKTLPPLLAQGAESNADNEVDPELAKAFYKRLDRAIAAYQERNRIESANPYPAEPDETCGDSDV